MSGFQPGDAERGWILAARHPRPHAHFPRLPCPPSWGDGYGSIKLTRRAWNVLMHAELFAADELLQADAYKLLTTSCCGRVTLREIADARAALMKERAS